MTRGSLIAAAVLVLVGALHSEGNAQAQRAALPGDDLVSLGLHIGALAPMQNLPDGTSFDSGIAGGLTGTVWPFRNLGVRASAMMGTSGGGPSFGTTSNAPPGTESPMIGLYSLELAARYPMSQGRFAWFPYAAGGIGGKQYRWSEHSTGVEWDLAFAWVMSGGVDIRPTASPRVGFVLDVSNFSSKYMWHGHFWDQPGVSDLRVTAGVTLNR